MTTNENSATGGATPAARRSTPPRVWLMDQFAGRQWTSPTEMARVLDQLQKEHYYRLALPGEDEDEDAVNMAYLEERDRLVARCAAVRSQTVADVTCKVETFASVIAEAYDLGDPQEDLALLRSALRDLAHLPPDLPIADPLPPSEAERRLIEGLAARVARVEAAAASVPRTRPADEIDWENEAMKALSVLRTVATELTALSRPTDWPGREELDVLTDLLILAQQRLDAVAAQAKGHEAR
jgi:hypothetical protein